MSELFHFNSGDWSLKHGHFDAAVRHFDNLLTSCTEQNRIVGLFKLAVAFKLNYCFNSAILCYEKALAMPTENIDTNVANRIKRTAQDEIEICIKIRNLSNSLSTIFQPKRLLIEPTNSCNYSCYKCLHPTMKRKKTMLDPVKYEKFLSSWSRRFGEFEEIIFTGGGEALLNKRLTEIVHISSRWMPYSQLTIGTNLSLLNEKLAKELIDAGLRSWEVSLDTAERDEYNKITGVDSFNTVINNIDLLWNALDKGKKGILEVAAHRPIDKYYPEKMRSIAELVNGKCTNFRPAPYHTLMGRNNNSDLELWEQTINFNSPLDIACSELWIHLVVTSDGNVRRCCSDMFDCPDSETFGNIFTNILDEIISNENRRTVQNNMRAHDIKDLYLCNKCAFLFKDTSTFKFGNKY